MSEFNVEFVGLPEWLTTNNLMKGTMFHQMKDVEVKHLDDLGPSFDYVERHIDNVSKFLESWGEFAENSLEIKYPKPHEVSFLGHRLKIANHESGDGWTQITFEYHPFVFHYTKRYKYVALRHKYLAMKGKLRNLKRRR